MKVESTKPLKVQLRSGSVFLSPGVPTDLPEEEALLLLSKARGRVRLVEPSETVIEPACRPDGSPVSSVYFERNDGAICGPAKVLDFMRASAGGPPRDWVVVEFGGCWEFVLSDRLRSKRQFETQVKPRPFERIEEYR